MNLESSDNTPFGVERHSETSSFIVSACLCRRRAEDKKQKNMKEIDSPLCEENK